jgi:hypothetical protein
VFRADAQVPALQIGYDKRRGLMKGWATIGAAAAIFGAAATILGVIAMLATSGH